MRMIDADALLAKFNKKADAWTALTDEKTAEDFALYCAVADAVEDLPTVGGWISVEGRLPEPEEKVLIWTKTGCMRYAQYHKDGSKNPWYVYEDDARAWTNVISHWMPLPEPPKEDDV